MILLVLYYIFIWNFYNTHDNSNILNNEMNTEEKEDKTF